MPQVPIIMPQLGESIAEAKIIRLNIAMGDSVVADQEIIEVETNKAMMGVTTLCGGTVTEIRAEEGVEYAGGKPVGNLRGDRGRDFPDWRSHDRRTSGTGTFGRG
jgi:pyruvate/2-oxoglutarate dehydrogenase complex dihydrolipoamide acyltransferase (E2) component